MKCWAIATRSPKAIAVSRRITISRCRSSWPTAPTYPAHGHINFANPAFSTETGTFLVRAVFDNPKAALRPGQFVRARVAGAMRPNAILVPQRAVLQGSKSHFVWVVDNDSKAHQRVVEVGEWHGDDWFITDGLKAGERIVVDGAIRVDGRHARSRSSQRAVRLAAARSHRQALRQARRNSRTRAGLRRPARRSERAATMNISHFCIDRPIFASVISIVITLGGALSMLALPIAQYPDITPPQITISATYPGASADVVANNVAAPIEQQVNGADNMIYMNSSSSSTGNLTINAFFEIGTNPRTRAGRRAEPREPGAAATAAVGAGAGHAGAKEVVGVHDGHRDLFAGPNATTRPTSPTTRTSTCSMRSSAFQAPTSRASSAHPDYAMRIWLKPDRMAQLGITASDVQKAVAEPEPAVCGRAASASRRPAPRSSSHLR